MFRRKTNRIADLEDRIARLRGQRDDALKQLGTERETRRIVVRQLAEADAANKRLDGRNRALRELLDLHRNADDAEEFDTLLRRIERLIRGCARYRADLARRPDAAEVQEIRRRLLVAEQARKRLDAQLAELQRANEELSRQAAGRPSEVPA